MTALRQSAIMELEKIPEDKLSFVIQIMQGVNGLYDDSNREKKAAFVRLEKLRKKGTVVDDAAEPDPDGAGVSAESGDVPVPWVRQRLCEGIPRSLGSLAEAEQAEVPLEKPAQLHLGRVQFNCRPVPLPHLPHPARAEGDLICPFS